MSLHGDVAEMPIGELLQTLTLNNHEGTLRIHSEKEGDRYFYLSKGEIQLISPGKKGLRIGEALVKANKITQEELNEALALHGETGRMIGKTLIEMQLIAEADIEAVIHQQFREEFFEVFLAAKGTFDFFFRTRPDQLVQFDPAVSRVSVNTASLMLEALRQIDEWQEMSKTIATPRAILTAVSDDEDDVAAAVDAVDPAPEVRKAVALIDGRNTVQEIVEKTPATKFDVYALLFQLVQRGAIRPLTVDECAEAAAEAEAENNTYHATCFYDYGAYLDPGDLGLRERQFKLLKRLKIYKEAKEAALAIADRKLEAKEPDVALQFYFEAQAADDKDIRAAEGVFRASLLLGTNNARSVKAGDEYVRLAIRYHEVKKAREALGALIDIDPHFQARLIQLADLQDDDSQGKARAIQLLDEAIEGLTRPEDATLRAEACRKLVALDPRRTDILASLKGAVHDEEELQKKKTRRMLAYAGSALALVLVAYLASYELGARRALAEADALAKGAGRDPTGLAQAIDAYKVMARNYPWSTVASRADETAGELRDRVREIKEEDAARKTEDEKRESAARREARRQEAIGLLRQAEAAERNQNWRDAAQAKLEVVNDYKDVRIDQRIRLPIPISTTPGGARILKGQEELGTTPGVAWADAGQELKVRVELAGYGPRDLAFKADRFEEAKIVLERTSLWTFQAGGAIETAPAVERGRVIVSARDGLCYAFDAANGVLLWKRKIGEYGDPLSPPGFAGGKCLVGTAEGIVHAFDPATGDTLWTFQAEGAVRGAARAAPDGAVAAFGDASGLAHFVRSANGAAAFAVRTESRIDAPIAIAPSGRAFVPSRDARIYAIDAQKGAIAWTFAGGDDFLAAPLLAGDLVICGARDGKVHALSAEDGKERWRAATAGRLRGEPALGHDGASVFVPSEDGALYALDLKTGSLIWRFPADAPLAAGPSVSDKGVYVASTAGTIFRVDPKSGNSSWVFKVGSRVVAGPVAHGGKVYVGAADGLFRAILE